MKSVFTIITCLAFSLTVVGSSAIDPPADRSVDALVAKRMMESGAPGMAVGILVSGRLVHKKGYGVSNVEVRSPVTPRSVFHLMSISKTFTAIAMLTLVEEGLASLDDPIGKHLKDLPSVWQPVTIRQILSNTSGIRSFVVDERRCNEEQSIESYKPGDVLKEVSCYSLKFTPGSAWDYSDTNFYIAGMIVEKVSGKSYASFGAEKIFAPLGMRTAQVFDYKKVIPGRVNGYVSTDRGLVNADRFDIDEYANGGLLGSLEDMLQFEKVFLTDRVLKLQTVQTMLTDLRPKEGDDRSGYGLGIGLTPYKGRRRFGHTGGGAGFATAFSHFPEERVTVIVLANAEQEGIGEFANRLGEIFFRR